MQNYPAAATKGSGPKRPSPRLTRPGLRAIFSSWCRDPGQTGSPPGLETPGLPGTCSIRSTIFTTSEFLIRTLPRRSFIDASSDDDSVERGKTMAELILMRFQDVRSATRRQILARELRKAAL